MTAVIVGEQTAERMAYLRSRPVVTVAEAVELTGLSIATIDRARFDGSLPFRKLGRAVRISTADLLAWAGASHSQDTESKETNR